MKKQETGKEGGFQRKGLENSQWGKREGNADLVKKYLSNWYRGKRAQVSKNLQKKKLGDKNLAAPELFGGGCVFGMI